MAPWVFGLLALLSVAPAAGADTLAERKVVRTDDFGIFYYGSAMSMHGKRLAVGAWGSSLPGIAAAGSVTLFQRSGTTWIEEQHLVAGDPMPQDQFGIAVALGWDVLAVGVHWDMVDDIWRHGSVRVFQRVDGTWLETQTLIASDGASNDQLGSAVALHRDVIVAGAPFDDVDGAANQGSATVFRRHGDRWIEEQRLVASDGAPNDRFGNAIACGEDMIIVGAYLDNGQRGSATVFRWDGVAWVETQTLTASDADTGRRFGASLALSGDVLVAGSSQDQIFAGPDQQQGSAFVFRWDGSSWVEEQKLTASQGDHGDHFGASVAIDGELIAVGAPDAETQGVFFGGSVTLFRREEGRWVELQRLSGHDQKPIDKFGTAVAVSGEVVLSGAPIKKVDSLNFRGVAYAFDLTLDAWFDEGSALTGAAGTPLLFGTGLLDPGSASSIELGYAAPDAPGALFLSASSAPMAFKGGTLVPELLLPLIPFSTTGSGEASFPFHMPVDELPVGTEIWIQLAVQDPGAVHGVALSNALRGVTP